MGFADRAALWAHHCLVWALFMGGPSRQQLCQRGPTQLMQRASSISRTVATTRRPLRACLAAARGRKGWRHLRVHPLNSVSPINRHCINPLKLSAWPKTDDAQVHRVVEEGRRRRKSPLPLRRQWLATNSEFSTVHEAHNWAVAASPWHNSITATGKGAYLRCFLLTHKSVQHSTWCVRVCLCMCDLATNRAVPENVKFGDLVFFFCHQMSSLTDGATGSPVNVSWPAQRELFLWPCRCELMKGTRAEASAVTLQIKCETETRKVQAGPQNVHTG